LLSKVLVSQDSALSFLLLARLLFFLGRKWTVVISLAGAWFYWTLINVSKV